MTNPITSVSGQGYGGSIRRTLDGRYETRATLSGVASVVERFNRYDDAHSELYRCMEAMRAGRPGVLPRVRATRLPRLPDAERLVGRHTQRTRRAA